MTPEKGQRVQLIYTDDPYTELRAGDKGIIDHIDDIGTVHVHWDNGSTLGLIPGKDLFRIL